MRCGKCGMILEPGDKFCSGCGSPTQRCCGSCGKPVEENARFCAECGAPLQGDQLGNTPKPAPKSAPSWGTIILLAGVVVLVALILIPGGLGDGIFGKLKSGGKEDPYTIVAQKEGERGETAVERVIIDHDGFQVTLNKIVRLGDIVPDTIRLDYTAVNQTGESLAFGYDSLHLGEYVQRSYLYHVVEPGETLECSQHIDVGVLPMLGIRNLNEISMNYWLKDGDTKNVIQVFPTTRISYDFSSRYAEYHVFSQEIWDDQDCRISVAGWQKVSDATTYVYFVLENKSSELRWIFSDGSWLLADDVEPGEKLLAYLACYDEDGVAGMEVQQPFEIMDEEYNVLTGFDMTLCFDEDGGLLAVK